MSHFGEPSPVIEVSIWRSQARVSAGSERFDVAGKMHCCRRSVGCSGLEQQAWNTSRDTAMVTAAKKQRQARSKPLNQFRGDITILEDTVKLPVYVGNVRKIVKFTIVYKPTIYNAIFGIPWIHSMKVIPSTYHKCIKILSPDGENTIRGSQSASRACFVAE
ncbi:hypothetical protein Bca101_018881 [Brassica carinata]